MPNVSVSNTPGLYIGSGASGVLNSAQQLYALLSNSGNVNFALINNNTAVQSYFIGNTGGGGGSYGNTEVAAYLPTYTGTLDNSSTIISLTGNAATQAIEIAGINANLSAFGTYANNTFGSTSFGNANVAIYLPTYTGTLDNSVTIINLWSNAAGQATAINGINANLGSFQTFSNANAATQATAIDTINANLGSFQTFSNANAATQATAINTINANLGAFQTYANNTFGTSSYGNANVAAYLPTYGGTINVLNITGVVGQDITIEPDGANDVSLNADTIKIGDNNTNATIVTRGTGNLQLGTHSGDANQGNITLVNGANGNIKLWPNGSGIVEAAGNVKANYFLGDGSQLINLPVQAGTYSNTNVAAYLPTYTGTLAQSTTIIDLYSNAATQATGINTINANLGAFQTYANATYGTSGYSNVNVAAYIPTYSGNIGNKGILSGEQYWLGSNIYIQSNSSSNYANGSLIQIQASGAGVNGLAMGNIALVANLIQLSGVGSSRIIMDSPTFFTGGAGTTANAATFSQGNLSIANRPVGGGPGNFGGYLFVDNTVRAGSLVTVDGVFWSNGNAYSTGETYGNTQVAAYLPTYIGNIGAVASSYVNAFKFTSNTGYFWANGTAYSTGGTYGNTEVGAYLTSGATAIQANLDKVTSTTGFFWANGTAYSTGGGGGGSDFTSNLTVNGNYILNANINLVREKFANIGTIIGTTTIDANVGMIQAAVVASNITINTNNLTNFVTGQTITLKLTQATNANLRILTSNILYAGGSKTLSTANAAIDTLSITWDGEQYLGALVKGYS